jgi:hypothetical protein
MAGFDTGLVIGATGGPLDMITQLKAWISDGIFFRGFGACRCAS